MGLPATRRSYLPAGVAAVCYREDDGAFAVLVSAAIQDRLSYGDARRAAYRAARAQGHDIAAITFEDLEQCRRRDNARTNAALQRLLSTRKAS